MKGVTPFLAFLPAVIAFSEPLAVFSEPVPVVEIADSIAESTTPQSPADHPIAAPPSPVIDPLPATRPPVPDVSIRVNNSIDNFIARRWRAERARPARLTDDGTFARRVYLDLAGVIPTLAELGRFLKQKRPDRAALIDELLESPRYADHWTAFWGDLLRETTRIRGAENFAFRDYVWRFLRENRPYDEWVRDMLTAEGPASENPATLFMLRNNVDANELTISVTQVFLGMRLKCVQCHDSLTAEAWTQDDFRGVAGFFSGTRRRLDRVESFQDRSGKTRERRFFAIHDPRKGNGRFFTGAVSEYGDGREGLADLVTRADNPYFARVAANRLWAKLMGTGLLDPPDAFSPDNPPSHPDLLDYLAFELIESGYDLKHIIRLICNSRTYQLDSAGGHPPAHDERRLYAEHGLKRLTAEQLWDSVLCCSGLNRLNPKRYSFAIDQFYPPRPNTFLAVFEAHDRRTIHDRTTEATIPQALALMNGPFINQAVIVHRHHPIRAWRKQGDTPGTMARKLFLRTLSREPSESERKAVLRYVLGEEEMSRWSDVHWALINTREFMFVP